MDDQVEPSKRSSKPVNTNVYIKDNISQGIWLKEKSLVKIEKLKGTLQNHTIQTADGHFLLPVAALYFVFKGELIILSHEDIILSVQECFAKLLSCQHKNFFIYSCLSNLGFKLSLKHLVMPSKNIVNEDDILKSESGEQDFYACKKFKKNDDVNEELSKILWDGSTKPLLSLNDNVNINDIMTSLTVIKTFDSETVHKYLDSYDEYDVYLPHTKHCKASVTPPFSRLFILNEDMAIDKCFVSLQQTLKTAKFNIIGFNSAAGPRFFQFSKFNSTPIISSSITQP